MRGPILALFKPCLFFQTSNQFYSVPQLQLAETLIENSALDLVFFGNSGAEANEGAVKVARRYAWSKNDKDRTEIICATGAFHGRTLAMLAANDRPLFREGFGPKVSGFSHVEWGDIESIKQKISCKTAAILVEPVQGEGGARKAPKGYLKKISNLANEFECLLISDEVQIGMGRSGTLFAYEQEDIEPDIIALAKGLGGGFPVGAVLAKSHVGDAMIPGTHGSTFGGNPLAMRCANVVLDLLTEKNFLKHLKEKIKYLDNKIIKLVSNNNEIYLKSKGSGMLRGVELSEKVSAANFSTLAREKGLLLVGAAENTIRILPPLNTSYEEMDFAIKVFEDLIGQIEN